MPKQLSVDPKLLRPNPWNTNIVSPENEGKIAASLKRLGQFKPLVVREKPDAATGTQYEILGGEHRWTIAINTGEATIDIYNVGVIDDDKAKEISIADNARYGVDDTLALAKLLEGMGSASELQEFLPYTEADVNAIFATSNIELDELDLSEEREEKREEPAAPKEAKTHTMMRFKVPIGDAERITDKIVRVQRDEGFTSSDEMTNAGDALVHLLLGSEEA